MEANPEYVDFLEGLNEIEKARLLHGNWHARPDGSTYFKRDWLLDASSVPPRSILCRAWDKASTKPSEVTPFPDFTASTKMYKSYENDFYIVGDYHEECYDKETDTYGRFKENPGTRDTLISKQAKMDGSICPVILPVDPGAAGVSEYLSASKMLTNDGIICKKDPMPTNASKLTRFSPFSSAAENGMVYILKDTFPRNTYDHLMKELESFDGERSSGHSNTKKDDWADCTASAFNYLAKQRMLGNLCMPGGAVNKNIQDMRAVTRS